MLRRNRLATLNAALAVLIVAVLAGLWLREPAATSAASEFHAPPAFPAAVKRPSVLFVGDSYTTGIVPVGRSSYPDAVGRAMGWYVAVDAEGATGFVADGQSIDPNRNRAIDRLARDQRLYHVDGIVVDLGRNDVWRPPAEVAAAAADYLAAVHREWPVAKVVLIMPTFLRRDPHYTGYEQLQSLLEQPLAAVGGTLLDPVGENWYSDPATDIDSMLAPDHVHPNAVGNLFVAGKIVDSLRAHGVDVAAEGV